jgi:hypothetical protein
MASHLRVFTEPDLYNLDVPPATVSVRLGDLLPLLAMAQKAKYSWLKDFMDDEVRITDDLYEVLQEFSGYKPSA